ncbi:hypothetical protein NC651_009799 [Populus alba x Populus x berolinensis]|nr:hypothetical protein NC651_009799 [Populus alba x Populus x berolinensis]
MAMAFLNVLRAPLYIIFFCCVYSWNPLCLPHKSMPFAPHECIPFLEYDLAENPNNRDSAIPLVSTHVPYCFLPESIISSACKIISIRRDAKDAFDSLWFFIARQIRCKNAEPLPLEDAFDLFCNGLASYGPYWDHVLGYWRASLESPEKTLFLTYE